MSPIGFDPISLAIAFALLALLPTVAVVGTTFLKLTVVMSLLRNALGIQQIPPNLALYGLSLILSVYIMAPVGASMHEEFVKQPQTTQSVERMVNAVTRGAEPLRGFMLKHSSREQRDFFLKTVGDLWAPEMAAKVKSTDFLILLPAFMITELTEAFKIGFLLFMPFVVIDLIVSNILLAMGMMMVSPTMISMPLKLFLFVMVDGWTRLIRGLILTYT
ncbi:MAG: type III secretion system export apparatus subunit SctR [Betaproteobacteria bacterium]